MTRTAGCGCQFDAIGHVFTDQCLCPPPMPNDQGRTTEIRAAVAEQEERAKRQASCRGAVGVAHAWRPHGNPRTREPFDACIVCGVTRTAEDYRIRLDRPARCPHGCGPLRWADDAWICPKCGDEFAADTGP